MGAIRQNPDYDLLVAGGGMIGTSLALAVAPLGLSIAVVEPVERGAPAQPSFDDRSTALSRSTQRIFEALGLWPGIARDAVRITRVHVSDRGRFGFSHIDAAEQRVEALGHVVVNRVLGQVLDAALAKTPGVTVHCPARVAAVAADGAAATVTIEDSDGRATRVSTRLLVAADGAGSAVRDMLGIDVRRTEYGQTAVIGNLLTEKPIGECAYERFTEAGPLALLPLTEGRSAFVWTLDNGEAARVAALADDAFLAELQAAFGYRLGTFSTVGARASYPLALTRAARITAPRAVLVGNAAHGLHPVAAQGFNLGLRDVAALADCIADELAAASDAGRPADIGTPAVLDRYADWRRSDQRKLVRFTDGLVRLFGRSNPAARILRDAGMLAFDLVPGVRRQFARHTMGLTGRLPRLARGIRLG
ncbi:MAG: 2-octaprenyl-6-methoxyphenyl hydroxylase [Woeseiaceae bacterium]|nr:2-octaprenyl-6-methoxyphenyl hydroxylase [Woeseiaceae bacterium]